MQKSFLFSGCGARLCAGQVFFFGQMACAPRGRAGGAGLVFSFGQVALRSAQARGRAGFFFELVLALVARGWFSFSVKWLCAPRGPEAELVFSLSWFSRWWRGADFILSVKWLCAPRGPEAELVFSLSWFSRWWRGGCFSFGQMACAPRGPEVGRGVSNPPSLPLDSTLPATS